MKNSNKDLEIFILGNTEGSIFTKVIKHTFVKNLIAEVIVSKPCGLVSAANQHGIKAKILQSNSGQEFSNKLIAYLDNKNPEKTLFFCFLSQLLSKSFVSRFQGRIVNMHPSLLPSFPGLSAFEKNYKSSSVLMGSTIHLVDEYVDEGTIISQAALPMNRLRSFESLRNDVFFLQYYQTLQFFKWIKEERVCLLEGNFELESSQFRPSIFLPNLDENFFDFINQKNYFEL
jgi:phosphoribosylglycinamide formyltransferase-1